LQEVLSCLEEMEPDHPAVVWEGVEEGEVVAEWEGQVRGLDPPGVAFAPTVGRGSPTR